MSSEVKRLGLIVNPIAGIGGRVGLKGSDGVDIQKRALELGAVPRAGDRAAQVLRVLGQKIKDLEILTPPGEMGADVARNAGFKPQVMGSITRGETTPEDTILAATAMCDSQVDLLVFSGGDGTARDIFRGIGDQIPALGIPAGVKIQSAVFATHPRAAGYLAAIYLSNRSPNLREAEVVDLDEEAYRQGIIATRLYGYLLVPHHSRLLQNSKAPTPASENVQMEAIAWDVVENMLPDCIYILGPGTTTRAVANRLGFKKTLVGVDVVAHDKLVALDVNEQQLLALIESTPARIVITPIGGQGFLFGRGNQPISAEVIKQIGRENLQVICTPGKLHTFGGRPLLVDTGDIDLDAQLSGHISITTGYRERAVYRIGN
jgi:predicted polyphosphate/ATP-dependent NAD kinase